MLNRVFQRKDASFRLGLVSDVAVLLTHPNHDSLVSGPPDNRGKDGARCIISSEASLAHARSIVNNESGNFFLSHLTLLLPLELENNPLNLDLSPLLLAYILLQQLYMAMPNNCSLSQQLSSTHEPITSPPFV
ncbi:unnamed protein product [Protopolystoma xenopodis]|uniref:Uncharacterized protein n=1 Tax=Protopolystoma xenopodis TaxID=117903 RepID=A0A448XD40_9PLAT|nr:unnamed protein product [Protopolystoma xenopodis]